MVAGYVRLSKDDNKKDYVSIENQKLILAQFAKAKGLIIERWYEDDGVSGYTLERPGFRKLLSDLEKDVDVILAKDLSRIGRHNAKVLLFLEEVKEMGKRVLLADDAYDSRLEEDDTLGIKTWFNERYVKDTSKKIRKAIRARQIEGTLAVNTPMGYLRNPLNKSQIMIDEKAAPFIRKIFSLYLSGYGFRAIAELLDREGVPTASMMERERLELQGKSYGKKVSVHWSPKMVGEIIKNDIYTGNMRYHKNERITIHGKDNRVDKNNHMVFHQHHPAIIDEDTYLTALEMLHQRIKGKYRGMNTGLKEKLDENMVRKYPNANISNKNTDDVITNYHQSLNKNSNTSNKYQGLLYCETCKSKMTLIHRIGREPYYLCGKYNSKGKQFCNQSKPIRISELDKIIRVYRSLTLRSNLQLTGQIYRNIVEEKFYYHEHQVQQINQELEKEKKELKYIMLQKIQFAIQDTASSDIQEEVRKEIENEKLIRIKQLQEGLEALKDQLNNRQNNLLIQTDEVKNSRYTKLTNYQIKEEAYNHHKFNDPQSTESTYLQELVTYLEDLEVTRAEIEGVIDHIIIAPDGQIRIFLTHCVYETGWYAGDGIRVYPEETGD